MKLWKSKQDKRREAFAEAVGEFGMKHKDAFMIFADPQTNVVVAAYQGQITGFHNTSQERKIREMFKLDAKDDQINGRLSKRNKAIAQFLFEIDGVVDAFAHQLANLKQGKKDLAKLEKGGKMRFGTESVDEKGNSKEIVVH